MDIHNLLTDFILTDDFLLSEDIWKQFHIEEMQFPSMPALDASACSMLCQKNCQVKYDCMWNGHCKGAHGNRSCNSKSSSPAGDRAPVAQVSSTSLLKPELKMGVDPNTVLPMTPLQALQTPPISDDEDIKPTHILQSLQSALSENELDDADLSDYFKGDDKDWDFFEDDLEDEDEEEEEDEKETMEEQLHKRQSEMRAAFYAASDHSYHKGTPSAATASLGIDTPSDSEEEIDVVSVGKPPSALPTCPSTKDRRQLQRTMQSRFPPSGGLKTLLPTKRAAPPSPKKLGAVGRPRQYKRVKGSGGGQRPYRRRCGYSSDSEPEPSEKRHLHNNMERQRRIDLRNLFNDLKKLVPDVSKKPRAAKVAILRGAAQYCQQLQYTGEMLAKRAEQMRAQQARFRAELSKLRRDVVAKR